MLDGETILDVVSGNEALGDIPDEKAGYAAPGMEQDHIPGLAVLAAVDREIRRFQRGRLDPALRVKIHSAQAPVERLFSIEDGVDRTPSPQQPGRNLSHSRTR